MKMENLYVVSLAASVIALVFAWLQSKKVLAFSEGTPLMQKISRAIRTGASAFLKRQYRTVAIFFACMFVVLCAMAAGGFVTWFVPFRRIFLRAVRFHRHDDRHARQLPHGRRRTGGAQPRIAHRLLRRQRHGLYGRRSGAP